jgi:UDP-N-acetylmuramyl pentapeptide phosphotransferase/UDP-N-acetylglucosamine-1-phosphate transferase
MAVLSFVLTGALFGFLIYNFHPAKIFMGDTGAMIIGFVVVYMLIQFITLNQANPDSVYFINNGPVFALAVLIIPVVDTLRVIGLRLWAGKSPLEADYNHLHHVCIKEGMDPGVASLFLWVCNLWIILIAFSIDYLDPNILAFIVLCAGFAIIPITRFLHFSLKRFNPDGFGKLFSQSKKEKV